MSVDVGKNEDGRDSSGHTRAQLQRRIVWLTASILAFVFMALAWQWSPLRDWLDIDHVVTVLRQLGQEYGPVAAVFGFAAALTAAIPLTFLTVVTMIAFGPAAGVACCLIGAQLGALSSYAMGAALGREAVRRLGGEAVNAVSARLAKRGVLTVVAVRMVPIAPFAVVNMIAGASHIRVPDLLLGTLLGMIPSTLFIAYFVDEILDALRQPTGASHLLLVLTLVLIAGGLWGARRWLRSTQDDG